MKEITLEINKAEVWEEVSKTTAYIGAKMTGDDEAYERIMVTDADAASIERFWTEACNDVCQVLKRFIVSERRGETYAIEMEMSNAFDDNLTASMQDGLKSYFVSAVTAKWCAWSNKGEAGEYMDAAASFLDDVVRKAYHKKRPVRPTYD